MAETVHYGFPLTLSSESGKPFRNWRMGLDGSGSNSVVERIDAALYDVASSIDVKVGAATADTLEDANDYTDNLFSAIPVVVWAATDPGGLKADDIWNEILN